MTWLLLNMWLVHGNDIVISTYKIYSMLIACYGLVYGNDIVTNTYDGKGKIFMKYTRYMSHIIGLAHINIIVISTWNYTRYTSHIT